MASSIFNIHADFKKSKNSFIFDKNNNKFYLDFFGLYSTNVLGYENKYFNNKKNNQIILDNFFFKFPTCEVSTDQTINFNKNFIKKTNISKNFDYVNFFSTGALAIESAIKASMYFKNFKQKIISFDNSFHGINSYGGIISDRKLSKKRLSNFPGNYFKQFKPYYNTQFHKNEIDIDTSFNLIEKEFEDNHNDICCCIIEPIQCTAGDLYVDIKYLEKLRNLTKKFNIPFIFDEIQTGFFTSKKIWYFEEINIIPDILVFGKKSQVSGIAINKKFSKIRNNTFMLDVTYNSDHLDMIRSNFILNFIIDRNLLKSRNSISEYLHKKLHKITFIKNLRSSGSLLAFDLANKKLRDNIYKKLYKKGVLVNISGSKTIRIRLNLLTSKSECNYFLKQLSI